MRIWVEGQGTVHLRKGDFVASGGEGAIYRRDGKAYKVYADPARALDPLKLAELARIQDPRVVAPEVAIRRSKRGAYCGYRMSFVADAEPLGRLFTRSFKERHGLGLDVSQRLAIELRARFRSIHAAGALVVDASELNFLVGRGFDRVYAIDCDSYQTPSFPATAITPTIADPLLPQTGPSHGSDWFAFAVLVFQLYTGLHPFRGKHPALKGLAERMARGVSAFDPKVRWPRATYPANVIPGGLRAWLQAVLEQQHRDRPPEDFGGATLTLARGAAAAGNDVLDLALLDELTATLRDIVVRPGARWLLADDGVYRDGRHIAGPPPIGARLALTPDGRGLLASLEADGELRLVDLQNGVALDLALRADRLATTDGRLYLQRGDKILEVLLRDVGHHVIATTRLCAQVLPHATRLFDGLAVQNLLGACYLSLFPQSGRHLQVHVPELDGGEVLAARADGPVAALVVRQGRKLTRAIVRVAPDLRYDLWLEPATSADPLPLVCLPTGVAARIGEDDALELFSARVGDPKRRRVEGGPVGADWQLARMGHKVLGASGGRVYRLALRRDDQPTATVQRSRPA